MVEKIKEVFSEYMDIDELDIMEDTVLSSDIGLSSLDYFDFIAQLEDKFNVTISDKELLGFRTVGDIIKCLESKI